MNGDGELPRLDEVAYSRRRFLTGAGVVAGAVVAGRVRRRLGPSARGRATGAAPRPPAKGRTVVFVELRGRQRRDRHRDARTPIRRTARLRPTLAVDAPIDLDGAVGLHPDLTTLGARYQAGQVAIVEGVGYPDNDLSHFASLANWWTAQPGAPGTTGWLGRYLDATVGFDDPLAGVVIGPGPSPAMLGARSFATSISDAIGPAAADAVVAHGRRRPPRPVGVDGATRGPAGTLWRARCDGPSPSPQRRAAISTGCSTARPPPTTPPSTSARTGGSTAVDWPSTSPRAWSPPTARRRSCTCTNLGDYDTHQGQAQRRPALMADLDAGLDRVPHHRRAAGVADR